MRLHLNSISILDHRIACHHAIITEIDGLFVLGSNATKVQESTLEFRPGVGKLSASRTALNYTIWFSAGQERIHVLLTVVI